MLIFITTTNNDDDDVNNNVDDDILKSIITPMMMMMMMMMMKPVELFYPKHGKVLRMSASVEQMKMMNLNLTGILYHSLKV